MSDVPQAMQLVFEAGRVFTPHAPVNEADLFSGRGDQIRAVIDAVSQRGQHAIIFGERGVGKTSLANVLSDFLSSPTAKVLAPKVNADTTDSFSSVWRKVFSEVSISETRDSAGFESEPTILQRTVADELPKTVTPDIVRRVLTRLGSSYLLIVIVDEFDRLSQEAAGVFADTVKTLSDHAVNATLVLVGVADSVDQLIQEHGSVERALVQIPMPRMSVDELKQIIENGLLRLKMSIYEDALTRITLLSQGLPHYTHLLGLHSARNAIDGEKKNIGIEHVGGAIRRAVDNAQQSIRNGYTTATASSRTESLFRQVLLACALAETDDLGYFSPAAVRGPMTALMERPYDIPSFSRHLYEFTEPDRGPVLQRTGVPRRYRYRFFNPLMRPFVLMRGIAEELINEERLADLVAG